MNTKQWVIGFAGAAFLGAAGFVLVEVYQESSRNRRVAEAFTREQIQAQSFAHCVVQELSGKGLKKLVVHQYKPAGLSWQDQIKWAAQYGLPTPPPPAGDSLHKFERQGDGLDWPAFQGLMQRCQPLGGPPFEERWRSLFWQSLSAEPQFQLAASEVAAENEAILASHRERAIVKKRRDDSAEAEQKERIDAELFKQRN